MRPPQIGSAASARPKWEGSRACNTVSGVNSVPPVGVGAKRRGGYAGGIGVVPVHEPGGGVGAALPSVQPSVAVVTKSRFRPGPPNAQHVHSRASAFCSPLR